MLDACKLVELHAVARYRDYDLCREPYVGDAHLHEVGSNAAYLLLLAKVDDYVDTASSYEALPLVIGICPAAAYTVGECCGTARVVSVVELCHGRVCHALALCKVIGVGECLLTRAELVGKVKGVVTLCTQCVDCLYCSLPEVLIVALRRVAPANLGNCEYSWIDHVLHKLLGRDVLYPEVALYTVDELCLLLTQSLGGVV